MPNGAYPLSWLHCLRTLGFSATNDIFAENAWYFRNALVRANYTNLQKGIHETTEYLEVFLRNLLLNEKNDLHNRDMHISGFLNTKKVDIESEKVDIQNKKVDIENILLEKGKDWFVNLCKSVFFLEGYYKICYNKDKKIRNVNYSWQSSMLNWWCATKIYSIM